MFSETHSLFHKLVFLFYFNLFEREKGEEVTFLFILLDMTYMGPTLRKNKFLVISKGT